MPVLHKNLARDSANTQKLRGFDEKCEGSGFEKGFDGDNTTVSVSPADFPFSEWQGLNGANS
jgi:hypothetical protein